MPHLLLEPRHEKTCLRGDTNQAVLPQMMVRGLKCRILEVEGLYYLCKENKGADQLRSYAQLICAFVYAYAKNMFSHDAAHLKAAVQIEIMVKLCLERHHAKTCHLGVRRDSIKLQRTARIF